MNNRQLKKILKERARRTEVKDCTKEILSAVSHSPAIKTQPAAASKPKKNFFRLMPAICATVAACVALAIMLPVFLKSAPPSGALTVTKIQQVFSYEMFALGNAVGSPETEHAAVFKSVRRAASKPLAESATADHEKVAKDVNGYLLTCDALTAGSMEIKYEYNREEKYLRYAYKLTVSYNDADSFAVTYTAYYNETERNVKEVEIEGIFKIDGNDYPLKGKRENDGDEVKMELEAEIGEDSHIKISNETESEESEYEYEYVVDGVVVKGVAIDTEYDGNEKSVEIEIIENDVKTVYEFTFENGVIECDYKAEETYRITIRTHEDYYLYEFEDGYKVQLPKV